MKTSIAFIFRKKNPLFYSIEKVFEPIMSITQKTGWQVKRVEAPYYTSGIFSLLKNIWKLRSVNTDVYHITGDIHYAVFAFPRKRTMLTIHDCVFIHQTTGVRKLMLTLLFLKWPVRYAKTVSTISENSKREIVQYSGCDPEKVVVIPDPLGSTISFSKLSFNMEKPTILFIGSTPNKNLPRVTEALKGISCHLLIVGKVSEEHQSKLVEYNISYNCVSGLSEAQLNECYANADMLLFPTLFEGFGLPIIEAQQAGRPVITSNRPPMNEVAGRGALLVDPFNVDAIRQAVIRLINEDEYRNSLISNGLENIKRFSPDLSASKYLAEYTKLQKARMKM